MPKTQFLQNTDNKQENMCSPEQENKCVCEDAPVQKIKRQSSAFSCLRSRDDVQSLTQPQELTLQAQNTQPVVSSVDISPERYRQCGSSVPVQRQLACASNSCRQQESPSEQTCSCENSDEIPYEKNFALHYEKCSEQPPAFAIQPLPCHCAQLENRELQSEQSGYQVPSELIESNYYEHGPVCTASSSKSQACSCMYPKEPPRDQIPCTSYVPNSTAPACQSNNDIQKSICGSTTQSHLKTCPRKYNVEPSREQIRCISSLPSYAPIPGTHSHQNNYNEQKSSCGTPLIQSQLKTCPRKYHEEPSREQIKSASCMPEIHPGQNNYVEQTPAQPSFTISHACSTQKPTNPPQMRSCPYCSAIEEQQQHQQQIRPGQESSHMPIDMNCNAPMITCPQDSENSSQLTTPCTYPTTDTETQESSTMSAKPIHTIIGCSYLSDEVFYSLSSESSEQDLTQCSRKNRQLKKHKKHGKAESKARNIVILQLLHEVVHLISDDENTKAHSPPVKRKIRNLSAISNDEADVGAFSSRTNLSSIKITILPGQAGSAPVSRQCTEGSETAATVVQPAQSFEVCYPMNGSQTVPCNLFIAPNLTCSNPNCNSRQGTPTATCQGKYSHGSMDKQNFFNWNPGTETINYALEELQPNAELICEPEIIEPDDQCNVCVESIPSASCKELPSDRYQGDDCCECFEPNIQRPQSSKEKPTAFHNSCNCFEQSVQRAKPSCDFFGLLNQQPKPCEQEHKTYSSGKDVLSDRCQCDDHGERAVLREQQEPTVCRPSDECSCYYEEQAVPQRYHKPRSVNTEYAFSSCGTTSSGEIGDRPTRSNKLRFLSMTPVDARTEIVPFGEEVCECDCDCVDNKEECSENKDQNDDCCEKRDDCKMEKEKCDFCDCCHCRAMRAKPNANICNTIATPQQVLDGDGVTEMKYFIDSIILDLDAMEAARRSKLGPQRPRQPSICPRKSFPVTIIDITDLGSSSLYVKWCIHDCYGIGGYEIYVDGHLTNRYFHCNHEAAVICDIDVTEPHKIVLLAQPKIDDNFDDLFNNRKDNKMDLVRQNSKSLLKRNDHMISPDINKAVNTLWTPSIYYYDPVNRKADCSKPKVCTC